MVTSLSNPDVPEVWKKQSSLQKFAEKIVCLRESWGSGVVRGWGNI